jgi:hypothetical protein
LIASEYPQAEGSLEEQPKLKESKIIRHHPKLLDRWATYYCKLAIKHGSQTAKMWALRHLTTPDIEAVTPVIKKKLGDMGLKPVA